MKKTFLAAMAGVLVSSTGAFAQESAPVEEVGASAPQVVVDGWPRNTLTLAPFSLLFGGVGLEYERAVSDGVSLFLAPGVSWAGLNVGGVSTSTLGFGANVGARFFVTGRAPEGFWLSPEAGFSYSTVQSSGAGAAVSSSTVSARLGAMIGYTFLFGKVFDLSLGLGGGAQYIDGNTSAGPFGDGSTTRFAGVIPYPAMRISLGAAF